MENDENNNLFGNNVNPDLGELVDPTLEPSTPTLPNNQPQMPNLNMDLPSKPMSEEIVHEEVSTPSTTLPADGEKELFADINSQDYIEFIEDRYDRELREANREFQAGRITPDEFGRRTMRAIINYNRGIYDYAANLERIYEQETTLFNEYDNNIQEQIRIQRQLNEKIKARVAEVRNQQRQRKKEEQLAREKAKTEVYRQRLGQLEQEEKEYTASLSR